MRSRAAPRRCSTGGACGAIVDARPSPPSTTSCAARRTAARARTSATPARRRTSRPPRSSSSSWTAAGDQFTDPPTGVSMQRRGEFRINVTKDYLVFASAHFITFAGHRCESLHGHNYRVGVVIEGALEDDNWYVLDFRVLKRLMKGYC